LTDPDVTPVGFAATDGPHARVRHTRNPLWLAATIVLTLGGLAGIGAFIAVFVDTDVRGDAVASGRIAALGGPSTPGVVFVAPAEGRYTVWLSSKGVFNDLNRDRIVAATNCSAAFARGGSTRFRGARQGSSVTLGSHSTVGVFTAPEGRVGVACHQEPFGRRRGRDVLRRERTFYVVPGEPGGDLWDWVLLFGGIAALVLAVPAGLRWRQGTLRERRALDPFSAG